MVRIISYYAFVFCLTFIETVSSNIHKAILDSVIPQSSPTCGVSQNNGSFNFSFEFSPTSSTWDDTNSQYEEQLYLAKLQHEDSNPNRTWTIQIGQAGNIYSFKGAYGEIIPPQAHPRAPWVDEVFQSVAVNLEKNSGTDAYFIHQAGIYMNDGNYTEQPFFSPKLASYCSSEENYCSFASWGQHAHVPTPWKSGMIYFNRYKDCGDGGKSPV